MITDPRIEPTALEEAADVIWMRANAEHGVCAEDRERESYAAAEEVTRDTISAYLAAVDKANLITTQEQLDALPDGTIVLDSHNFPWQKVVALSDAFPAPLVAWLSFGTADLCGTPRLVLFGPFTVLTAKPATIRKSIPGAAIYGYSPEEMGSTSNEEGSEA